MPSIRLLVLSTFVCGFALRAHDVFAALSARGSGASRSSVDRVLLTLTQRGRLRTTEKQSQPAFVLRDEVHHVTLHCRLCKHSEHLALAEAPALFQRLMDNFGHDLVEADFNVTGICAPCIARSNGDVPRAKLKAGKNSPISQ